MKTITSSVVMALAAIPIVAGPYDSAGGFVSKRPPVEKRLFRSASVDAKIDEVRECLALLEKSDAGKGFMHESYDKDNPARHSRSWFAWANTLFGELVLDLYESGRLPSITRKR